MTVAATKGVKAGLPYPLGSSFDGEGTNFAVFSAHATKIEVCLFDAQGQVERERIALPEYTDQVWHGYLPGIRAGDCYGLRVTGPYEPEWGHRFNPNKLLLDPYALAHRGLLSWNPALFGYRLESGDDLTFDDRDSAPFVPKCVVTKSSTERELHHPSRRVPWDATVVYELHVGGYTMLLPDVPKQLRGKYGGLGSKAVVNYIRSLGVTTVELLPIHSFLSGSLLLEKGLTNYWGYNTIGFFVPERRYSADPSNASQEFKEMVARFHDAGLEVILDVVYNHTAEGNELGPTISFKGIDNLTYYRLVPDQPRYYLNYSGTGNTINIASARVVQLVMDSLRYWVEEMGVDGFRFDLAAALGRDGNGFSNQSGFLKTCAQDPALANVKLIAEPWDIGPDGYQVGGFPPGWSEWNDKFRDVVRDFWRFEAPISALVPKLCASAEQFNHAGRRPWESINFVTSHDGFTLNDVVSYNEKHNELNGENNQDGTSDNRSWNCGVEGPSEDPGIVDLRQRQIKNLLSTLLLAQGTPMILAGDEFGRTQNGNNNAYCQDNETSWVDWTLCQKNAPLLEFTRKLIELRHTFPILRSGTFLNGELIRRGIRDVTWIHPRGYRMQERHWHDPLIRCFAMLLDGRAQSGLAAHSGKKAMLLIVFNGCPGAADFTLPPAGATGAWSRLLDTNLAADAPEAPPLKPGTNYTTIGRSVLIFQFRKTARLAPDHA